MIDLRQSPTYASYMASCGWIVENVPPFSFSRQPHSHRKPSISVYIKRLPRLPFSVMKIQRFEVLPDFLLLKTLIRENHAIAVTLEPGNIPSLSSSQLAIIMHQHGFWQSRSPLLPTKTVRIDLSQDKRQILASMSKDARASIRKSKRRCIRKIFSHGSAQTLGHFHDFWRRNGRGSILTKSDFTALLRAFRDNSFVVTGFSKNGILLAGAVILIADRIAYYAYAFTSPAGRRQLAGYLVVWDAIREAKKRGCRVLDLEGIYDPRFPHLKRWKGFSMFKQKFGGEVISYPGPFVRFFFPFSLSTFSSLR